LGTIDLDVKDLTILNRLNEKGRATYSEIADELMLTVPTVKARIDKLVKIGVINHFGIYLNPHALTNDTAAILSFHVHTEELRTFLDHLRSLKEIKTVFEVLDSYNLLVITHFQPLNLHQVLFEELLTHPSVKQGKIQILVKEIQSKPHQIPKSTTSLNLKCDYCGKQITGEYESLKLKDTRYYFCCTSCLANYKQWYEKTTSKLTS
jgi:DNA-binding Lrp family transcriptional regulator